MVILEPLEQADIAPRLLRLKMCHLGHYLSCAVIFAGLGFDFGEPCGKRMMRRGAHHLLHALRWLALDQRLRPRNKDRKHMQATV